MKKVKFSIAISAALMIFALVFTACPPVEEDGLGFVLKYAEPLDMYMWFNILDDVMNDGRYIVLDLKDCTYVEDNLFAGLVKVKIDDGTDEEEYIAFDPFPAIRMGKDRIVSIILPDEAQMINRAMEDAIIIDIDDDDDDDEEELIIWSAFRYFKNLSSVKGANVTHIGNYAFMDCVSLKEADFPRVGHTVSAAELADEDNEMVNGFRIDIGEYAFKGCTGLTSVTFNSAAVIGMYAFKDCTSLSEFNFPVVWMISQNAFEGCTSLTGVRFESATKIGEEAFKDCVNLKKAYFDANPPPAVGDPLDGSGAVYDSVIFYKAAFSGCESLQLLDIRPAWNVFFYDNVLEKTGTAIDIYLFADSGTRYGHPQTRDFLGDDDITLEEINLYVPIGTKDIIEDEDYGIAGYINIFYPDIDVTITEIAR